VLFVCVHNAGRSQMAAALLAHHAGDLVVVRSAGTAPAGTINPAVVEAMAEIGIDLLAGGAHPKRLDDAAVEASDVVITMGCGDECPFYPGKRYLDWALADPAGQGVDAVRPIRDEIDRRVRALLAELLPERAIAVLPDGLELVRTTPEFSEHTIPAGLRAAHQTATGVWGRLVVRSGAARFVFEDHPDTSFLLTAGDSLAIPPQRPHHVIVTGPVRFVVEFYR